MGASNRVDGGIPKDGIEPAAGGRPRGVDRLSDLQCRSAKPEPGAGIRKLSDGRGLYLAVMPTGAKLWRMKYRHEGKERVYSIGAYDEIGLAEARRKRDEARAWLREGLDPTKQRKAVRSARANLQGQTFADVAHEYLAKRTFRDSAAGRRWRAAHEKRIDVDFATIGALPIATITPAQVLECLRAIEKRGALEMAAKARRFASQVFRYAVASALRHDDPAALLVGAIQSPVTEHRATVDRKEMPKLLAAVAKVPAEANTKLAFYWTVLNVVRTGDTRFAAWGEIEERGTRWRLPADREGRKKPKHGEPRELVVPLSRQAREVLAKAAELRQSEGPEALLFPGFTAHGALSENALLALLARAGYFSRQTTHGFRALFSTWASEVHEADPDHIEACLAHAIPGVRGDYNRATYVKQRAPLLQAWADQLTTWGMRLP